MSRGETFSFKQLDLDGIPKNVRTSRSFENEGGGNLLDSFCSGLSFNHEEDYRAEEGNFVSKNQHENQLRQFMRCGGFDDLYFDIVSPAFQPCVEEIQKVVDAGIEKLETREAKKERPCTISSLEILQKYASGFKRLNGEKLRASGYDIESAKLSRQNLSTPAILHLAAEKFIQSSTPQKSDFSILGHPYADSFQKLSEEDRQDIQLVQNLLAAAEKVGEKQFYRAGKLLKKCKKMRLEKGNPVQRLVYVLSAALRERIDRETRRCSSKGSGKMLALFVENMFASTSSTVLAFQKAVPFAYINEFAGIQAILEKVTGARKVHIIDLQIRMGTQYTMLMQALSARADCPVEHLKITAIGTNCKSAIEDTGGRLTSFAESFNLPFSFSVVMVEDVLDLTRDLFELAADESVVVYSEFWLMSLLERPNRLESLMRVIRDINPCLMVVTEVEVNMNSPVFVTRFTEALFYYGAFFDAFEDSLKDDETNRMVMESMFFNRGIKNVVAAEGEERTIRHVKINVWRAFFQRFGMVEIELSRSSLYQANLVRKRFRCGSSCTLHMDGKCLIVGWKGIPTQSLSVWKFE